MNQIVRALVVILGAIPFAVIAADRTLQFPRLGPLSSKSLIVAEGYRSIITRRDAMHDDIPAKRGVLHTRPLNEVVQIPAGHALSLCIATDSQFMGSEYLPIDIRFLDIMKDHELCVLCVPYNYLTCQQLKSLSRFSRLIELDVTVEKDPGDPRCIDGLKGLEVLSLAFHERQDGKKATDWVEAVVRHKSLKSLKLHHFRVNDDNLKLLSSLEKLELLQFNDGLPEVTDRGLSELVRLKNLREVCLSVGGPSITDAGLKSFFEMPRLEKLTLYGDYSLRARERLQRAHPKVDFEFSDVRRE